MATTYEVQGWLGPAADTATDEQVAALVRAFTAIDERWPDPDDADTREAAAEGAARVVLGDDTLEQVAADWRQARARERRAMAVLTGAMLVSGGTERELVERTGVARMTVRKALGR